MEDNISHTLQDALRGDTTAAADMWRAIAGGRASPADTQLWAKTVAARIVGGVIDADLCAANRRAEAALHAIGFYGRIDKARQLRSDVLILDTGENRPSSAEIVKTIQLLTSDLDGVPLKNAIKKVDRLRKKI